MHTTGRIALLALLASQRAAVVTAVSGSGVTTRYWDCCKPSCSWPGKASVDHPVLSCDSNDNILSNQNAQNGCETGGSSFTCTDNVPWAVDSTLSYGFAATKLAGGDESTSCCACYQLTFSPDTPLAGKTMIVQSTNTGGDLDDNHFDLLVPGGGVGIFQDGCTREFGQPFPGTPYGGVGPSPGDGSGRAGCDGLPTQRLREGCYWYFDWLQGTANPPVEFKQIRCPEVLVQKSGCRRADDGEFPEPAVGGTGTGCTTSGCVTSTTSSGITTPPTEPPQVAPVYGQCGGQGWTGPTVCAAGSSCQVQNQYYSQCLPGSAAGSSDWQTSTTTAGPAPSPAALYGQCGGQGWTGPTMCAAGSSCQVQNQYYSQCLPN